MVDQLKLAEIFTPTARERRQKLDDCGIRIAHYTTAENAYKIVKSQSLWMRNTLNMDDYREIEHGHDLLLEYFGDNSKWNWLLSILDRCCGESGRKAIDLFNKHYDDIRRFTYIACFSEHEPKHRDHGRLSMWRAFGQGSAGVAIVLNPPKRESSAPLQAFLVPVMYYTQQMLRQELDRIFKNIESHESYLKDVSQEELFRWAFIMLVAFVTSLKHPGFEEEKEWRLIHLPKTFPSLHVAEEMQVIGGIPQVIRKVDLINNLSAGINDISIPQLLDRVIVGPTQYGYSIVESLTKLLTGIGVQNADQKVFPSKIPIRT